MKRAVHAFLPFDLLKGTLNERPPRLSSVGGSERRGRFSHPISHRTPEYRMGKDSIRLLVAINKRLNFLTQQDRKIQDRIGGNSLGNRWRSPALVCHLVLPASVRNVRAAATEGFFGYAVA
jgi:hypothetical protein